MSEIPFRDFDWKGPFVVEELLPNETCTPKANKIQIIRSVSQGKNIEFSLKSPIRIQEVNWPIDGFFIKHQDGLHTLTWKENFGISVLDTLLYIVTWRRILQVLPGFKNRHCPLINSKNLARLRTIGIKIPLTLQNTELQSKNFSSRAQFLWPLNK